MVAETNKQEHNYKKTIISFISGGIAGSVSKTLISPIQRIKFLFITSNRTFTYKLFKADFFQVINKHGVLNLWRGNMMNIVRIFPQAAIDFSVFDYLRAHFYVKDGSLKQKINLFFCGAIAGVTSLTFTTPLEFVRVRLMMEKDSFTYKNNTNAIVTIMKKQGFLGFYRGYGAAVYGIFVYHGCSFFVFTKLKQLVKKSAPNHYSKWYVDFMLGGLAAIGQLVAYPFDVARRRMQGQKLLLQKGQITTLSNYKQLCKEIYHKEGGIKGFYKGISLNMIKAPISLATVWTVKNSIHRYLDANYDF